MGLLRAVRNGPSKIVLGLTVVFLVFASSTARAGAPGETFDFQLCHGYFALCDASLCNATGKQITFKTAAGGTATALEAECTCPVILGHALANLAGGNMQGSCAPPGPDQLWSIWEATRSEIPQALTDWVPTAPAPTAPTLQCPSSLKVGDQFTQCFSFLCDSETYINNVPVVTCRCPIGVDIAGNPTKRNASFVTRAGKGDPEICLQASRFHPVGTNIGSLP